MRVRRLAIAVAFAFLLVFSNLPKVSFSQTGRPIDEGIAKFYAETLLSTYLGQAREYRALNTNFTANEQYFALYNGAGSFEVQVMWYNSSEPDIVGFVFSPITASNPDVVIDYNDTIQGLQSVRVTSGGNTFNYVISPYYGTYGTATFFPYLQTPYGTNQSSLYWVTSIAYVMNDTKANAVNAGDFIFQSNLDYIKGVRAHFCSQIANWPTCAVDWLEGDPIVLLVLIIFGGIYGLLETTGKGLRHLMKHRDKK